MREAVKILDDRRKADIAKQRAVNEALLAAYEKKAKPEYAAIVTALRESLK